MKSVELFAGAGGLLLGVAQAGFDAFLAVERDKWACDTLTDNKNRGFAPLNGVEIACQDVREVDLRGLEGRVDLLTGGPPCQPFSIGGKGKAFNDDRDMFNAFANALAAVKPKAFIIENVKGLTRGAFSEYLRYIISRVESPEIAPKRGEKWPEHHKRLIKESALTGHKGVRYVVSHRLYNAADMGVPQKRERVFIVGFRADLTQNWSFPEYTHGLDALLRDQWITGEYWDRHKVAVKDREDISAQHARRVAVLKRQGAQQDLLPWLTVRDALAGLPAPYDKGHQGHPLNHVFQAGARPYPGHTGSPVDMPAKALKAGNHGVPGGENMIRFPDGSVRYFTIRESARLQGFPDEYEFRGSWGEAMRQLGNAVPVPLAKSIARSVAQALSRREHA